MFQKIPDQRCRYTEYPSATDYSTGYWPVVLGTSNFFCGEVNCPTNTYCRQSWEYNGIETYSDIDNPNLFYGLTYFKDISMAMYSNLL